MIFFPFFPSLVPFLFPMSMLDDMILNIVDKACFFFLLLWGSTLFVALDKLGLEFENSFTFLFHSFFIYTKTTHANKKISYLV